MLPINLAPDRPADVVIGPRDRPYMERWRISERPGDELYLHKISRSDDDRALHDHKADNESIILSGRYVEVLAPAKNKLKDSLGRVLNFRSLEWDLAHPVELVRGPGDRVFRVAEQPHRLVILDGPVWTLWRKMGDRRDWGFWPKRTYYDGDWAEETHVEYVWQQHEDYHREFGGEQFGDAPLMIQGETVADYHRRIGVMK